MINKIISLGISKREAEELKDVHDSKETIAK